MLRENGSAGLNVQARLEPRMTNFIRSLNSAMGSASNEPLLDGRAISQSMAASPGVLAVLLENTGPASLEGDIIIGKIEEFVTNSKGAPFITYENRSSGNRPAGRMVVFLDRNNIGGLVALLSSEVRDYLSALMAPIVEEEEMTKNEYLSLVASIYGRPIAEEIREAMIHAVIDFPGRITSIKGGRPVGTLAVFDIPILDLLVLETPLSWEVIW